MPRVRFINIPCPQCWEPHKVRLERLDGGGPIECLACGVTFPVATYAPLLQALNTYSSAVLEVEKHGEVDGDTLVLPKKAVTVPSLL